MIKELLLAIILGALLGFGVTGGFFALNKNKNLSITNSITPTVSLTNNDTSSNQQITPTINPQASNEKLIINSPVNNSVVTSSKVTLSGITTPSSNVIITTPLKSYITQTNSTGSFEIDISLESGFNQIQVTAIDEQDNQTETIINITYSTAKI